MKRYSNTRSTLHVAAAVAGLMGLAAAGQALGCNGLPVPGGHDAAPGRSAPPSAYATAGDFLRTSYEGPQGGNFGGPSIVGLWKFVMKVEGQPFDFGTIIWHGDGTENTISGGREPSTGDVCMGAWEQIGRSTYQLNHLALPWSGGAYVGVTHFHQTVKLDPSGNSYSGYFTLEAFLDSTSDPFDESTQPVATISGTVTATRVEPN
ncbi:MAG TPA: hypothetical protein VMU44_07675 [Steroidobacteraceae bacterium]|nr:hypothetical protein [Steroidobacteraceae bacterium]